MLTWAEARAACHAAGAAVPPVTETVPLGLADGRTLAEPLVTLTDLPAFPTSSVDGWAGRGAQPWRVVGRVLAGDDPGPLDEDGTCVEIATGASVPGGVTAIVRIEESSTGPDGVRGEARAMRDWRDVGEEAARGEELLSAGTPVTPGVIGLAASCGYHALAVRRPLRAELLVFGDELLTEGLPGAGRVRDALGPQLPAWLARYGCEVAPVEPPVKDTLEAHIAAIEAALTRADLVCTTGGTMHGPVDHLHPALAALGAEYVVNTAKVRPGFPMLLARLPGGKFLGGLPGNPQSAVVALVSLVAPLLAGLTGRRADLPRVTLGSDIPGRGDYTHLALVRLDADGLAHALPHAGSSMLRGLARAVGFAVIPPGAHGTAGTVVELAPLPLYPGELA
ncbi:molybdopterin molybdenumtransferase MoeA [Longispora fulva]|uniref:Molybdopterin molybdenumtransferase n=1 Tax=Longispora fulva TaxID=619741 RepID=A0A8J7GK69_9ACTN|nr:molybdopterin molybdotransferase MoeA [Longispora fulva]MBG6139676.1 molybdopterin molybdotransferase [Longispora fulva]GIG57942.1 molybdopterin molybdenumtransferase MoeA [Longispora fulva]